MFARDLSLESGEYLVTSVTGKKEERKKWQLKMKCWFAAGGKCVSCRFVCFSFFLT